MGDIWKIGRKGVGDGLLVVVAKDDRRMRIAPAKTLEGVVPDLAARRIIDEAITPRFRKTTSRAGLKRRSTGSSGGRRRAAAGAVARPGGAAAAAAASTG